MIDPTQEETAGLSAEVVTPVGGPSEAAQRMLQDTEVPIVQLGQWALVWRRFKRHHLALAGAITLGLLALMGIFAPLVSPESFFGNWNFVAGPVPPRWTLPWNTDWRYIMGADIQGHSLLMWIAYGARVSLSVGLLSSLLTMVIAIIVGATAGYYGGWVDAVMMRISDIFLTLPFLPLLILLADYAAGGNWVTIVFLFGVLSWPGAARLVRSYYLTFRVQEFTEAARAVGVSDTRIIYRHILPNALSPLIVAATLNVAGFIIAEAAIDFLGVGIRQPAVSWGVALSNSQNYILQGIWWWTFFPGLFLLITVLSFNFLGDGLRDALDVRSRAH
ncbi:MAG TPA: ABC transporter permease [Chloroflexota bacterium]|nr:ABC transporter permease [Chloroflexota bacterium]